MNDLISALRQFITRDLMFVLGGSYVLIALFLHIFGPVAPPQDTSGAMFALWLGTAYVVGFAVQECLSLSRIITTQPVIQPGPIVSRAYSKLTKTDWESVTKELERESHQLFEAKAGDREYENYQRILSLKQIGTAVGSCLFVTFFLLVSAAWRFQSLVLYAASLFALFSSIVLLLMGWVKGAQQVQFTVNWYRYNKDA